MHLYMHTYTHVYIYIHHDYCTPRNLTSSLRVQPLVRHECPSCSKLFRSPSRVRWRSFYGVVVVLVPTRSGVFVFSLAPSSSYLLLLACLPRRPRTCCYWLAHPSPSYLLLLASSLSSSYLLLLASPPSFCSHASPSRTCRLPLAAFIVLTRVSLLVALMQLARHSVVHTGEKPFACPTCDARFVTRSINST